MASNSPRRRQLLAKILTNFEVIPAVSPEVCTATKPEEVVKQLAAHKAVEVWNSNRDALVIGCDTVVDLNGKILGKPRDVCEASQMLNSLSGKSHFVHTGLCVVCGSEKTVLCETSSVTFRELSQAEIDSYVASGAPMDKAGAYGIQECDFISAYGGSYDNIVGLPTETLAAVLVEKFGIGAD